MPELPEVETTCRGIAPHISGKLVRHFIIRQAQLRWPVSSNLVDELPGQHITEVSRRAKYILLHTNTGVLVIHLGMSGSLRIVDQSVLVGKHDHVDIVFDDNIVLRFNDPRRFGAVLWLTGQLTQHQLFSRLGPEPLSSECHANYLYEKSRQRKLPVKSFIMDSHVLVGVGNIYASEALFMAGIDPRRQAGRISLNRYHLLVEAIKSVLQQAILQGGTTLKDFVNSEGKPGYFQQSLNVYGRCGDPCPQCSTLIKQVTIGQRSSFFCGSCQT